MAQLERAYLAPASGAVGIAAGAGAAVATEGRTAAQPLSFSQLLQADGSANPTAGVPAQGLAMAGLAPVVANPPVSPLELAVVDPASSGEAGELLAVAALALEAEPAADEGESAALEETAAGTDIGDGDAETAAGAVLAEVPWPGLPLFMAARAALREAGSASVESSSPSGVAAAAGSVDSARPRFMLRAAPAPGRWVEGGRGPARLTGEPMPGTLNDTGVSSAARSAVAEAGGLPLSGMGLLARSASGVTDAIPLAHLAARLADFPPRSGPVATGVASLETPGLAAVAGVERATAPAATATAGDEPVVTSHEIASERQAGQAARGRPAQGYPLFAEACAGTESGLLAGVQAASGGAAPVGAARSATAAATVGIVGDAGGPPPTGGPDLAALATAAQACRRSADAVVAPMTARPEEVLPDVAAIRAGESPPPANGGTPIQATAPSTAPARPDAGTAPALPPTAPDVLDLQRKNWERTLGHQLNWMVSNRVQEAEIRVNPPDLGPLEVRVSLHHNQTSVTFFSHEAAVREAIESALPRLREMLDGQGISLSQAQVSDQSLARQQSGSGEQAFQGSRNGGWPLAAEAETRDEGAGQPARSRGLPGMVDDYA